MTVKSSISLSDEQHAFIHRLVEQGQYNSASAVLQQGLELLRRKVESEGTETEALRLLLAERRGGRFRSAEETDRALDAMMESKRRAHGLDG